MRSFSGGNATLFQKKIFVTKRRGAGFVEEPALGIVGASAGCGELLRRIKGLLQKSENPLTAKVFARLSFV